MTSDAGFVVREPMAKGTTGPHEYLKRSPVKGHPSTSATCTAAGSPRDIETPDKAAPMTNSGKHVHQHRVREAHQKEVHVGGSPHTHNAAISKARHDAKRRLANSNRVGASSPTPLRFARCVWPGWFLRLRVSE